MAIQWFPGHMNLTRKAIAERIKDIDVVIEVLDARLPGSSANPLLAELTGHKPTLKILNKQDVADADRTQQWLQHYNAQPGTRAVALQASDAAATQRLAPACHALAPGRGGMAKPMRVLICGVPNVGKSTLINTLTNKRHAKTGDEAGITKLEQRITLADDFYLYDTPGLLWPRIIVAKSGYNLAASGAIGRNAYDEEEVALELLDYLRRDYPALLEARFKLSRRGRDEGRGSAGRHRPPARRAAGQGQDQHPEGRRDRDHGVPRRDAGPHHAGNARGVRAVAGGGAAAGCAAAGEESGEGGQGQDTALLKEALKEFEAFLTCVRDRLHMGPRLQRCSPATDMDRVKGSAG